jgi:hypothetical protein
MRRCSAVAVAAVGSAKRMTLTVEGLLGSRASTVVARQVAAPIGGEIVTAVRREAPDKRVRSHLDHVTPPAQGELTARALHHLEEGYPVLRVHVDG